MLEKVQKCIKNAHLKNPKNERTFNLSQKIRNFEIAASGGVQKKPWNSSFEIISKFGEES